MIPGKCQPKFIDADENTEASDLYYNKGGFYETEQAYIKEKTKGKKKRRKLLDSEVQSIIDTIKQLEKDEDTESSGNFDEEEDDIDTRTMRDFHRL